MESLLPLNLAGILSSNEESATARSRVKSTARSSARSKSTARSRTKSTARLSARMTARTNDSDPDFIDDDSSEYESGEEEEWVAAVDEETSVEAAMEALWSVDPRTFYVRGKKIRTMLEYKFQHQWKRKEDASVK